MMTLTELQNYAEPVLGTLEAISCDGALIHAKNKHYNQIRIALVLLTRYTRIPNTAKIIEYAIYAEESIKQAIVWMESVTATGKEY